ncbi:glycosyltransferase family 2 protein [Nonomuraea sp. NPDC050790]|uniref:glycosyltransferase family 2 protein n=1 Tax=Nonomuraea sp. NPDC050790 TaxID=3364371 RepID=UPI0037B82A09
MTVTPCGFRRTPEKGMARLRWAGRGWTAEGEGLPAAPPGRLDLPALRPLRGLEVEWPDGPVPLGEIVRLAAAGVPLTAARASCEPSAARGRASGPASVRAPAWVPASVRAPAWVPAGLAELLTDREWLACAPGCGLRCVADLRREEHSVRLRRLAARLAGTPGEFPASFAGEVACASRPKVSVVMSTKRPHLVSEALAQMARQRNVEVEAVIGLHGVPYEAVRAAVESAPLPVSCVESQAAFGEVLNQAAGRAGGDYLVKWDDDDFYGPEHLSDLLLAMRATGADIVGATGEFFYLEPLNTTIRRTTFASGAAYPSEVWADHVAGGTILLDAAKFRSLGGFPALPRAVDKAFLKAAQAQGARIYRTHGLGYVLRRTLSDEHTWQLPLSHFLKVAANQWRGFRPSRLMEAA